MSNRRPQESCRPWSWLIFDVGQNDQKRVAMRTSVVDPKGTQPSEFRVRVVSYDAQTGVERESLVFER